MAPLAILLAVIIASIGVLFLLTGIRVVGLVLVIVPCVSVVWVMLQTRGAGPHGMGGGMSQRLSDFAFTELPSLRGEIILLMMAGYIGTVGSALLEPTFAGLGWDLAVLPTWLILVGLVWLIPLAGQIGMNPIMAVTLIAPLIPSAQALGVSPSAIIVAITAVGLLQLEQAGVRVVGVVPQGLPGLTLPTLDFDLAVQLLPAALPSRTGTGGEDDSDAVNAASSAAVGRQRSVRMNWLCQANSVTTCTATRCSGCEPPNSCWRNSRGRAAMCANCGIMGRRAASSSLALACCSTITRVTSCSPLAFPPRSTRTPDWRALVSGRIFTTWPLLTAANPLMPSTLWNSS
mgnify:CR=1 FL=1